MLEKIMKIFNVLLTIVVVIAILFIALLFSAKKISKNINEAKTFSFVPKRINEIHRNAHKFKEQFNEFPQSISALDSVFEREENDIVDFQIQIKGDTIVVIGTVKENDKVNKELWGETVSKDNFENTTYSHDLLKDKYLKAYLRDAKKVEVQQHPLPAR